MSAAASLLDQACSEFERHQLTARDGCPLVTYECGPTAGPASSPTVIIVNPIGVPVVIASRLAQRLSVRYRVICWEQRGYDLTKSEFFARAHDFESFVTDLLDVAAQRAAMPHALVGLCSGAALCVSAVARNLLAAARLVLVNPAIHFQDGYVPSIFDRSFIPYMRKISAGDQRVAQGVMEMRAAGLAEQHAAAGDEAIIAAADTASLRSLDTLTVYARTAQTFTDQRLDAELARVPQKVSVFAAADDTTVSIQTVRQLCKLLPAAKLHEYPSGGHHMVFLSREVQDAISAAIETAGA